jgi:hypothetical protein
MKLLLAAIAVGLGALASIAQAKPPLRNPAVLNIGFVCRWNAHCMARQEKAMKRALGYVRKKDPPNWKIQYCNRNASRGGSTRVDWIGYDNCIRNPRVRLASPGKR